MTLDWEPVRPAWREARGPTMRPPSRLRTRILLVLVAGGMGLLVGLQASGRDSAESRLAAESTDDLTLILSDLNAEADRLARQVSSLRVRETRLRSAATREDVLVEEVQAQLEDLQVLSGVVPATGPGLVLTITDPMRSVRWDALLDLVQELRDAGAEAIAIGPVRVVAATWLGPVRNGVTVGGTVVRGPYEVRAIGDARGLREALAIPGGPLSVLGSQPGVVLAVAQDRDLSVPALQQEMAFRYARPA
jgi:uncharacterized protein YlxW (UPF0749 family)